MSGGTGRDTMHGGRGDDLMFGNEGDDTLRGAQGDDILRGNEGDDLLIGGEGNDVFGYYLTADSAAETDTIKDFTQGSDKILLDGTSEITFDDLFLSQDDSFAIIQAGDTTIRLKGVEADDLTEDDFEFG